MASLECNDQLSQKKMAMTIRRTMKAFGLTETNGHN